MLSDLIDKKKGYRKAENTSDNETNNEESLSDIENQEVKEEEEKEKEEVASFFFSHATLLNIHTYS